MTILFNGSLISKCVSNCTPESDVFFSRIQYFVSENGFVQNSKLYRLSLENSSNSSSNQSWYLRCTIPEKYEGIYCYNESQMLFGLSIKTESVHHKVTCQGSKWDYDPVIAHNGPMILFTCSRHTITLSQETN